MNKITIKTLSENALIHLKKNIDVITDKIIVNDTNDWIFNEFPQPMFVDKKYEINNFDLIDNPDSKDKNIDFLNSINLYENLNELPPYILSDERFWLWLHLDKYYYVVKRMMRINGKSTIQNMWLHTQGVRRGLMFGVLSRCYYRVALTIDDSNENKYELTKWAIENPERYRNLTWRSFSSEKHLVRGALKGEKRAIEQYPDKESNSIYPEISKYISIIGSVKLLDAISAQDIEQMVYEKTIELIGLGNYAQ